MADAVADAGPLIHLRQVGLEHVLTDLYTVSTTRMVTEEVGGETEGVEVVDLTGEAKDFSKYLAERQGLDAGEATAIALCRQEDVTLLFTDDLAARDAAKHLGLEPPGTLGLVTRAFREDVLSRDGAVEAVTALHRDSSLFITKDLVDWAVRKIDGYGEE